MTSCVARCSDDEFATQIGDGDHNELYEEPLISHPQEEIGTADDGNGGEANK